MVDPARWQRHILTSVVKPLGSSVYGVVADHARGRLRPGVRKAGLADGALDLAWSGGYLDSVRPRLEEMRRGVVAGDVIVPHVP